jgi:prevent-host-death family protein
MYRAIENPDYMKKIRIGELKKGFSRYINQVKGGESILVLRRNQPVARIIPLQTAMRDQASNQERLARLERQGLIRWGTGDPEKWLEKRRPTKVRGSVRKDLLDERRNEL